MEAVKLPADVELEDRLAFGCTGKQLALLAGTAVSAYGAFLLLAPLVPATLALAAALLVAALGVVLALVRHQGVSGDQLALALARFALTPKRRVLAPEGLPSRLAGGPRQRRLAPLDIPIRRERQPRPAQLTLSRLAEDTVELLRGAEVALQPLDGDQVAALLAQSLDPPGPLAGSHLTGVIHASANPHPPTDRTGDQA